MTRYRSFVSSTGAFIVVPEENEKSEPFSNRKQVRIFLVWWRWWDSNPRARLRTKRFRVFESVGGSWFRSAVMGSRRHFLRLAKVAHQRNLQAKIDHFLRSAVRKASFHTKRQGLYFRCSSVRCSLEYTSAAVAVPAHSRLLCLNAAFPESRGRCVFFCPQTGLKGKPPCQHSASIKTSTTPL